MIKSLHKSIIFIITIVAILNVLSVGIVSASIVTVSGIGIWNESAPETDFSAPKQTWSFSFNLPNPIADNPTTEATNFNYLLNGKPVNSPPQLILFHDMNSSGMFDLFFQDTVVSIFGADIGSTKTLVLGSYQVTSGINGYDGYGTGTVTATPIPDTILLLGTGLFVLAVLAKKYREDIRVI